MAISLRYDPKKIAEYAIACRALELGSPRVRVLGPNIIQVYCYGGIEKRVTSMYMYDVPYSQTALFKVVEHDIELILSQFPELKQIYEQTKNGIITEETKRLATSIAKKLGVLI